MRDWKDDEGGVEALFFSVALALVVFIDKQSPWW